MSFVAGFRTGCIQVSQRAGRFPIVKEKKVGLQVARDCFEFENLRS